MMIFLSCDFQQDRLVEMEEQEEGSKRKNVKNVWNEDTKNDSRYATLDLTKMKLRSQRDMNGKAIQGEMETAVGRC